MQINFLYIFFVLLHILYQMQVMIFREPDTPVITTREFFGILTSISFKLCSFAPLILIYSIYYSIPQSFLTFTFSFLIFLSLFFYFFLYLYLSNFTYLYICTTSATIVNIIIMLLNIVSSFLVFSISILSSSFFCSLSLSSSIFFFASSSSFSVFSLSSLKI